MFKYTFDPRLRYELFEKKTHGTAWWDTQWRHRVEFIKEIEAEQYNIFSIMHQVEIFCCHYSEKELQFVPVGGWLIPVKYFEVEIV